MNLREAAQAAWDSRKIASRYNDEHGLTDYWEVDDDAFSVLGCALAEPPWTSVDISPDEGAMCWLARGDEVGWGWQFDVDLWWYTLPGCESELVDDITHWKYVDYPDPPKGER